MKSSNSVLYLRYSTADQADGQSEQRQTQNAERWCKDNKSKLTKIYKDLGVSGGKSADQRKGLSSLLSDLSKGDVPQFVLCEDVDRLSRQLPLDSLNLISKILDYGVTIVSLRDNQVLTKDNWQTSQSFLILSLKTTLANEERQKRIFRGKSAWKQKRVDSPNKIYTRKVPGWLKVEGDKIVRKPEHVATVKRMFELANDGLGILAMIRLFNQEKVPSFHGNDWNRAIIHNTLTSESVLGHFQPKTFGQMRDDKGELLWEDKNKTIPKMGRVEDGEKITNYFPKIIEPTLFYSVQAKLKQRNKYRGGGFRFDRKPGKNNLFSGLIKCAKCGGSMINLSRSRSGYNYLVCTKAHKYKECDYRTVSTNILEEIFGNFLTSHQFTRVSKTFNDTPKAADGVRLQLNEVEKQLSKYLKLIEESEDLPKTIINKIADLEKKQTELQKELESKTIEDSQAARRPKLFEDFCKEMETGLKDVMGRARISSMMKDVVKEIVVDPKACTMRVHWVDGLLSDKFDWLQWDKKAAEYWFLTPISGNRDYSRGDYTLECVQKGEEKDA